MKVKEDKRALVDDVRKLEVDNERIRNEVAVSGMNQMQVQLVQVSAFCWCLLNLMLNAKIIFDSFACAILDGRKMRQISTEMFGLSLNSIGKKLSLLFFLAREPSGTATRARTGRERWQWV